MRSESIVIVRDRFPYVIAEALVEAMSGPFSRPCDLGVNLRPAKKDMG